MVQLTFTQFNATRCCELCGSSLVVNGQKIGRRRFCKKCVRIHFLRYQREYALANKDIRREKARIYKKKRRNTDLNFKISDNLRVRIRTAMRRATKKTSAIKYLGCTIAQLREHLARNFKPGMSWQNYGAGWVVDHIRPVASYDLTDPHQQQECFHYSNLQPLWAKENRIKKDKWITKG
jgi:hypothetical protein